MRGLSGLAWRTLRARPFRTALTIVGVALGVGVLFAGLATNAGIEASAERTAHDLLGRTDLRVASFGESGLGSETRDAIASTPGVAIVAPGLERRTYLGAITQAGGLPPSVTVLGVDPTAEAQLHPWPLSAGVALTSGQAPEALITERLAHEDGLRIGSNVTVFGAGDPGEYRVVGVLAGDGPLGGAAGRTVIVPLKTAQAVFDELGVTRVDVGVTAGADPDAVARAFESRLLVEPYTVQTPADLATALRASTAEVSATTALIAAIALFAGAFLILNTLSMTVIERVREVGLLRAAGTTRGQVRTVVLLQALVIGVVGSAIGLLLGGLLAFGMVAYLRTIGSVTLETPTLPVSAIVISMIVGVVVTIAAALEPARRAARISPIDALKARLEPSTARGARVRWLAVVLLGVAAIGLLLWPWTGGASGAAGAIRALAVYGVLLVATLLIPFLIPALARLGGLPFRLPLALEERIARATLVRDRSRATLTVGALTVGLALVVALGSVGQQARAAASAWVEAVVPGDVLVTSIRPIAADEGISADLAAVEGVARVSPIATFDLAVDGVSTDGAAMVGADLAADGRLTLTAGDRATALAALDAGGAAVVPRAMADRLGLALDDTLSIAAVEGGTIPVRVVGIADRTLPGRDGEALIVGWGDAMDHFGVAGADAFAVRFEPNAPASVLDGLTAVTSLAALEVVTLDRVHGAIDDALGRVFGLFDALALVAVIVAALGIANTLTMNVMERVREIGILRAAGMTRRQVWRSVVVEAGMVGVAGALLGVLTGLIAGALMIVLAGGHVTVADSVPWASIGLAVVLSVALAMLAAAYPARIAARISIPNAVAYE